MGFKKKLGHLWYRIKVRKEIGNLEDELLKITYEEVQKEINRRNKGVKK